jgi:hypothetical protein
MPTILLSVFATIALLIGVAIGANMPDDNSRFGQWAVILWVGTVSICGYALAYYFSLGVSHVDCS